jgi:GAF domain/ANTAR domain
MNGDDRLMRIAVAFARASATPWAGLCSACVDVLDVSGAGITVMAGGQPGPLCVSDARTAVLEDLQFTAGEGPCRDAYDTRIPVFATQLDVATSERWPAFVDLAISSGIGAVFAYPLSASGAAIGVLTLYQDDTGALSAGQHDDSVMIAEILTEALLSLQDAAPDGVLAAELDDAVAYRAQIHQASGMVSIQLGVSAHDALSVIRAYAFSHDMPVDQVAVAIVERRLRLDDGDRPEGV